MKEGSVNTTWKLNIDEIIRQAEEGESDIIINWESLACAGDAPQPMSHHTAFVYEDQLYCYGGLLGMQGQDSNADFYILNLKTRVWTHKSLKQYQKVKRWVSDPGNPTMKTELEVEEECGCEARDQHSAVFDEDGAIMYVFGGYVAGDKANDLWSYSLNEGKWTCLHPGDYMALN